MFTGLVQGVGRVLHVGKRLVVQAPKAWRSEPWQMGESVAVNGCCLSVVEWELGLGFDASEETLSRTMLGTLKAGEAVNLERAMKVGDRLGGHIVQGHVDEVGLCVSVAELDGSWEYSFQVSSHGDRYLIDKGSIAVNGVSLTVIQPSEGLFKVSVIPVTMRSTNFGSLNAGEPVNIEFDMLAKHLEKLSLAATSRPSEQ